MKYRIVWLLLLLLPLTGCKKEEPAISKIFILENVEIWHNLMPGGSPLLYFSALMKSSSNERPKDVKVNSVTLYSGETELAVFKNPVLEVVSSAEPDSNGTSPSIRVIPSSGVQYGAGIYSNIRCEVKVQSGDNEITLKYTGLDIQKVY